MEEKFMILLILSSIAKSNSVDVSCSPGKYNYHSPPIPCCEVTHNLIITSEYEPFNIIGYNKEFKGFMVDQKSISYLPSGIEKCCGTIEVLIIKNSSLKDITDSNLQSFPDVSVLDLSFNKIRILEEGLFQYNLKMQILYLNGNQIVAMIPTVFDNNLQKLKYLNMNGNQCQVTITTNWNINPYIAFLNGKDNCTNDRRLTITRNIVKIEKVEANLKYVYDMHSKKANLESRLNRVEQNVERLSSHVDSSPVTNEHINMTSNLQNETNRRNFFLILIALMIFTYSINFLFLYCIYPKEDNQDDEVYNHQAILRNDSVRFDPRDGFSLS